MNNNRPAIYIRVNGIGHAFGRELGCNCNRCRTVDFSMTAPSGRLTTFDGWPDPPWRAHTSASILIPAKENADKVGSHILVDAGAGVIDSLVCSKLTGLEKIKAILISHWHNDHVSGLNQLAPGLKRTAKRNGVEFLKVPLYCSLKTFDKLKVEMSHVLAKMLDFVEVIPGCSFSISTDPPLTFVPLEVAHGIVEGSLIYLAQIDKKKIIFAWDMDLPKAKHPHSNKSNIEVINENLSALRDADLLFMSANTWEASGTGHTSFLAALEQYISKINPRKTYLVHLSGHEDEPGNPGFGWNDLDWSSHMLSFSNAQIAKQGMILTI